MMAQLRIKYHSKLNFGNPFNLSHFAYVYTEPESL